MTGQTVILATDRARQLAHALIDRAEPNSVLTIAPARRTIPQNKRMQAMLSDVARAKPGGRVLTSDKWKCLFMDSAAIETGNPSFQADWQPSLDGTHAVNLGYRSSRLIKADMGTLMDLIDAWGTQNGVRWSLEERAAA